MPPAPAPPLCKIRLDNIAPGHFKFYELTLVYTPAEKSQVRLITRYGRIGTAGKLPEQQPQTSVDQVIGELSAKLKEKAKKRYQITENPVKFVIPDISASADRALLRDVYNRVGHALDRSFGASIVMVDLVDLEPSVETLATENVASFKAQASSVGNIFARRKKEALFDI